MSIAAELVRLLLEDDETQVPPPQMEASVRLPPRSAIWVATFTGPERAGRCGVAPA